MRSGAASFNLSELESLDLQIEGSNLTSRTKLSSGKIKLIEIAENDVLIAVTEKSCSQGHSLSLVISATRGGGAPLLQNQVIGVAAEVLEDSLGWQRVRLVFRQYSIKDWQTILDYFFDRQTSVNALIQVTRK